MNTPSPEHAPVMLSEIVALLAPALGGEAPSSDSATAGSPVRAPVLVDCTLGLGGHAEALLNACPQARLIGLDRDPAALAIAADRLAPFADRLDLVEAVYDELPQVLDDLEIASVQAILLDLGVSSMQLDDAGRGFAYAKDAPLDMRMGRQDLTAATVLNTYPRSDLARILRRYGEERFAGPIARRIVEEREREPFDSSARLVELLYQTIPMSSRKTGGHPAKRTFQALRIEVNAELAALESVLPSAIGALAIAGRIAVLAYHSLEDRLVKQILTVGSTDRAPRGLPVVPAGFGPELKLLTRGAERPTSEESALNPRAASARLRAAVRIDHSLPPHRPSLEVSV